jgi:hypothetical protein
MIEKGLRRGREAYEGKERWTWWTQSHHNWNQVCNGGMILGALAVAEEEPELSAFIVTSALKSLPKAMASFAPDGGWAEGPGYWAYTVRYTVPLIAALESALGSDFGLAGTKGFDRTGTFHLYFVGPTGKSFNFADGSEGVGSNPAMRWLARRFRQPLYHWAAERSAGDGSAMDLLWYEPVDQGPKAAGAPLDMLFRGIDVAFLRSAWEDPDALYAGFKGGDNKANHSHLDLGTFVFDALGERWAVELGGDNYNLPAYFGNQRWTYYRLRTEGQNTLLLNDQNQDPKAAPPLVAFLSRPERAFAVADLTAGYAPLARRVRRGVALVDGRRSFLVQDEIEAPEPVAYRWLMHTRAAVQVHESAATLTQDGKTVRVRVLEPDGATLVAANATPPPPQNPNEGITRLEVRLPDKVTTARIAVLLTPQKDGQRAADSIQVTPLEEWVREAGPLPAVGGPLRSGR